MSNQLQQHQCELQQHEIHVYQFSDLDDDDESSSDTVDSRASYHEQMRTYIYDSSHESMPSLYTDSEDDDWNDDESTDEIINHVQSHEINVIDMGSHENLQNHNQNHNHNYIFQCNNIHFVYNDQQPPVRIGHSDEYPPNLDPTITAGACANEQSNQFTNVTFSNGLINNRNLNYDNDHIVIIQNSCDDTDPCILFSHCETFIHNGQCVLSTINTVEYDEDIIEDIYYGRKIRIVRSRNTQWYLHVPIAFENGKVAKTRVFADPGANTPCIDTDYAAKHFPNMISKIKAVKPVHVPGGWIKPKYCLWMSFPTKKGTILKSKFLLVNNLPVKILLDINILEAFGYQFKEETPEIFCHSEKDELDLKLNDFGEHLTNYDRNINHNWFNCVTQQKLNQVKNEDMFGNDDNRITLYDKVSGDGDILYDKSNNIIITSEGEDDLNVVVLDNDNGEKNSVNNNKNVSCNNGKMEIEDNGDNDNIDNNNNNQNVNNLVNNNQNGNSVSNANKEYITNINIRHHDHKCDNLSNKAINDVTSINLIHYKLKFFMWCS